MFFTYLNISGDKTLHNIYYKWIRYIWGFLLMVYAFNRIPYSTFGLTQKYQKVKADEGMSAKATLEIIHAIRAVHE